MDERLNRWEVLFQRALILIDSVSKIAIPVDDWTFWSSQDSVDTAPALPMS